MKNLYNLFEVPEFSDIKTLQKTYYKLIKQYYSNKNINASEEQLIEFEFKARELNQAWIILSNKHTKNEYDTALKNSRAGNDNKKSYSAIIFENILFKDTWNIEKIDENQERIWQLMYKIEERKKEVIKSAMKELVEKYKYLKYIINDINILKIQIKEHKKLLDEKTTELEKFHNKFSYQFLPNLFKSKDNEIKNQIEILKKEIKYLEIQLELMETDCNKIKLSIGVYPDECLNEDEELIRLNLELEKAKEERNNIKKVNTC